MGRPRVRNDELRERLLDGALRIAAEHGTAAITTRAVAASASSSPAAVDELFGGKPGLARAMFVEGFARLATALAAVPFVGDPEADALALAGAYRRFARSERPLFEVMFSKPFAEFAPTGDDMRAAGDVHREVMRRSTALVGPTASRAAAKDAALALTAVMQGLATMELAGILGSGRASVDRRWTTTLQATIRGLMAVAAEEPRR